MTVHAVVPASVIPFIGTEVTDAWTPTPGGPSIVAITIPVEGYADDIQALVRFVMAVSDHCQVDMHGMPGLTPQLLRSGLAARLTAWDAQEGREMSPSAITVVDPTVAARYGYHLN